MKLTDVNLKNEYAFGDLTSFGKILSDAMPIVFSVAILSVTIYFIIGAFKFLTSGGDKNAVTGAREMIIHSLIGFMLLILLFLIVEFIPQILGLDLRVFQ